MEIFRIESTSKRLIFLKQYNAAAVYTDRIEVIQGKYEDVIYTEDIENIYIAEPWTEDYKERVTIIDNYDEDGEPSRLELEDSLFDNKLSRRMEELIKREWFFVQEMKCMTPSRRWMNTAVALFYLDDDRDLTTFGGMMPTEDNAEGNADVLEDWDINCRRATEKMLESLLNDQSTKEFFEENARSELADFIRKEFGFRGIKAWDYVRAIQFASMAYLAGYISIEDASEWGLRAAEKLQNTFTGWDEMYANYLAGHSYWSNESICKKGSDSYSLNQIHERLIAAPNAPYKQIDWSYPLKKDW